MPVEDMSAESFGTLGAYGGPDTLETVHPLDFAIRLSDVSDSTFRFVPVEFSTILSCKHVVSTWGFLPNSARCQACMFGSSFIVLGLVCEERQLRIGCGHCCHTLCWVPLELNPQTCVRKLL